MTMFFPSSYPSWRSPISSASTWRLYSAYENTPRKPIRKVFLDVCARAVSGHATAPPPSSDMNARRLMERTRRLRAAYYHAVGEERRCASQQKLRDDVADGSRPVRLITSRTFPVRPR